MRISIKALKVANTPIFNLLSLAWGTSTSQSCE